SKEVRAGINARFAAKASPRTSPQPFHPQTADGCDDPLPAPLSRDGWVVGEELLLAGPHIRRQRHCDDRPKLRTRKQPRRRVRLHSSILEWDTEAGVALGSLACI